MLIKNAEIYPESKCTDIKIWEGEICDVRPNIDVEGDEVVVEADGGALLPGLHDHHIHLVSLAASLASVACGPPDVQSAEQLGEILSQLNGEEKPGWVRGIGYHESVAGDIDRDWLDKFISNRPIRIQHRGGRLWILNSLALDHFGEALLNCPPDGLERLNGRLTGRLYEADVWLREQVGSVIPSLSEVSRLLASFGVTGVTDTTPSNDGEILAFFSTSQENGQLLQSLRLMGGLELSAVKTNQKLQNQNIIIGELKIHLLESQLPEFDGLCVEIQQAHNSGRAVAFHCVTLTELMFSLSALETSGCQEGDRIEHASIVPPYAMEKIKALGLRVVTQPHFISERGDQYLRDVPYDEQAWLYRCRGFLNADIPLAAGSDAPFGRPDPWASMKAAVNRTTVSGHVMDENEILTPEQALELFICDPAFPGIQRKRILPQQRADLCLLDCSWSQARRALDSRHVAATIIGGEIFYRA